jgi:hypothetical protein
MNLNNAPERIQQVIVQRVTSKPMAEIWSQLFQEVFGYGKRTLSQNRL